MLSDWKRYAHERILIPKIGVLWVLLSAGVWFVAGGELTHVLWAPAIAGLFIVSFRLMDDLADRAHDGVAHPERCLVRTRHVNTFVAMAVGLFIALALLTTFGLGLRQGLGIFALAFTLFVVSKAYGWGAERREIVAASVLLKYPAVILLVAAEPLRLSTVVVAAVFYIIPFADEVLA